MSIAPSVENLVEHIERSAELIKGVVAKTPLIALPALDDLTGATVFLKCEHLQHTGSFKARGAAAKIMALEAAGDHRPIITASSGNHGLGVAYALARTGKRGSVCVPEGASPVKVAAIRRLGIDVRHLGREAGATEVLARTEATKGDLVYISPYNDADVIAGQGTIGLEIADQVGAGGVDVVIVSVGGGGLASGVAAAVKSRFPSALIVGASPKNDAAMATSIQAGRIVTPESLPTLSDGTAGGIEPGAITFELCQKLVDTWVLVTEEEIRSALKLVIDTQHQLIEGAAAVAVAAAVKSGQTLAGKRVVIVSCGANISSAALATALNANDKALSPVQ